jgi:lipopolysaccharide transport system ATP-binding protein
MIILKVNNLSKAYKKYTSKWDRLNEWLYLNKKVYHKVEWILRDITFEVNSGEALGIIGNNGAGKSTLLKMIAGTIRPTMGKIQKNGIVTAILELGIGLHPEFTGRENIYMISQIMGINNSEIKKIIPEIEKFAEIGDYIDMPVRIYSSGMVVRLSFSVAISVRPDLLIVDEALSVGDAYFQQKCYSKIKEFKEKGTALILVSHDMAAISTFCEKVLWIDSGLIRKNGKTKEVIEEYTENIFTKKQVTQIDKYKNIYENKPKKNNKDMRMEFISRTNLRNDIKLIEFKNNIKSWGKSQVKIIDVSLIDDNGLVYTWIVGGETVNVILEVHAIESVNSLIFGFLLKNKYGQILFGDNTYLTYLNNAINMREGEKVSVLFKFDMPILPIGIYTLTAAVISGEQKDYFVLDWKDDAIRFESQNSWSNNGLIGIPMHEIKVIKIKN